MLLEPGPHNLTVDELSKTAADLTTIGFSADGMPFALASEIIINSLGPGFWAKETTTFGKAQDLFSHKQQVRAIHLADLIWRLKSVDGFSEFLTRTRQGDFESAYYELFIASLFQSEASSVSLVSPSTIPGQRDFDVRAFDAFGMPMIAVEVKARKFSFRSENHVKNALKKARGQLPAGGHGGIFLKIELGSPETSITQEQLDRAIRTFLENTTRVALVGYLWDASLDEIAIALAYRCLTADGEIQFPPRRNFESQPTFMQDFMAR